MSIRTRSVRGVAGAGLAVLVIGLSAPPVNARPDVGDGLPTPAGYTYTNCPLERVGDQYVRCDNLTGAGVPAAPSIPEQGAGTVVTRHGEAAGPCGSSPG